MAILCRLIWHISAINPAAQLATHEVFDQINAGVTVVEARDMGEFGSTRMFEGLPSLNGDLFESFQAIRDKTRRS